MDAVPGGCQVVINLAAEAAFRRQLPTTTEVRPARWWAMVEPFGEGRTSRFGDGA